MNIFILSQPELFDYYTTMLKQTELKNITMENPPEKHTVVVYVTHSQPSDVFTLGHNGNGFVMTAMVINVTDLKEGQISVIRNLEGCPIFAAFSDTTLEEPLKACLRNGLAMYEDLHESNYNMPQWTYLEERGTMNMNPPLLRPEATIKTMRELRAYSMMNPGAKLVRSKSIVCESATSPDLVAII